MKSFPSFQPTDVLSSFSLTDVVPSTFWRPSTNFHFPADVLLRSPPTDDFSRFPPTDDLKRTFPRLFRKITKKIDVFLRFFDISAYRRFFRDFRLPTTFIGPSNIFKKKIRKKETSFQDFSIFPPTDVFLRFPPSDDLQETFRRLFEKTRKKYLSCYTTWPILIKFQKKYQKFRLPTTYRRPSEISTYRRPSGILLTSF